MSRKLYLIRHSYAEGISEKPDFDRSLTLEGQSTIRALGRYLIKQDFDPDIILCSSSLRTTESAINLVEELGMSDRIIEFKDVIYNASVRELLTTINEVSNDHRSVVLIGHNPTITFFAEYITGAPIGNMDPSGLATISLEKLGWSEVSKGTGIFEGYYHPSHTNV